MKFTVLLTGLAIGGQVAHGYAGMNKKFIDDIKVVARQADEAGSGDQFDSHELLGNLKTLKNKELTETGKLIKKMLTGKGNPESGEQYKKVPRLTSYNCRKDTCCVWQYISNEMERLFKGRSGRCTKWARFAVRLGFHDAGAWDKYMDFGGADGSIAIQPDEKSAGENMGLGAIIEKVQDWYHKYHDNLGFTEVTHADLIQMAASVATVVCPLGPRMRTFVGRPDGDKLNPTSLLPSVHAPAADLVDLFRNKTIGPHGLVALVGAHTTSQQHFVDTSKPGAPQDSTPGVWDVLFYGQTLRKKVPKRIFKFPSDEKLSVYSETKDEWKEFAGKGGQDHWNEDFAREYIRLSLLGVYDINGMTECTKVLPKMIKNFKSKDQKKIDKWLSTDSYDGESAKIGSSLDDADVVEKEPEQAGEIIPLESQEEQPNEGETITEEDVNP